MLKKYEKTQQRVINNGMTANLSLRHVYEKLAHQLPKLSSHSKDKCKIFGFGNKFGRISRRDQGRKTLTEMFVNNAKANN